MPRPPALDSPESTPAAIALVVRAATVLDRAPAVRLFAAWRAEQGLSGDEDGVARAVELALSAGSSAWLLMALSHGLAVGVLLANPSVSVAHGGAALRLEAIYVLPGRRGHGVERALVDLVAEEARQNGMRAIEAEAQRAEEASVLSDCGFVEVARTRLSRAL